MKNMERLWNEPLAHISSVLLRHRCTSTSSCHTYSKVLKKDHHLHMCVQHLYLANRAWQCPINTYERCEGPTKWSFTNCLRSQQDTNVFAQQFLVLFWHQHKWYRNQKASKDVVSPIERVWYNEFYSHKNGWMALKKAWDLSAEIFREFFCSPFLSGIFWENERQLHLHDYSFSVGFR